MNILKVKNLQTNFKTKNEDLEAIRDISFNVIKGDSLGIVGESGSGKSLTVKSIMHILPKNGYINSGSIVFEGNDITNMDDEQFRKLQGNEISIIFQDPMTALNPLKTVGFHIDEVLIRHLGLTKSQARQRTIELLKMVEIPNPHLRVNEYPHQFSGGMRQRVMIALSLACNPKLLIADEPTTALDVTIQAQILKLLKNLQQEYKMTIILITHDLAVVYSMCSSVIVMYGGKIMEQGLKDEIFNNPNHPYTVALLNSLPDMNSEKLNSIEGLAPSLQTMPKGCPFASRCNKATEICFKEFPNKTELTNTHNVFCYEVGDNNE